MDLDRKQLETKDKMGWRTIQVVCIWNIEKVTVISYFQRIEFQPERLKDNIRRKGIAATTTCHRSSGAKVRSDRPVPILGRPCQRRWRSHAGDQPPEQSSVGMHQEVLPGALRPAESTVEITY